MAMAQLRKNSSGSSKITGSVAGQRASSIFPEKYAVKNGKSPLKSVADKAATTNMTPARAQAAQKPGSVRPGGELCFLPQAGRLQRR